MSLRHTLLVLLAERPHTGYELTQRMQRTVALFWSA
ncbi:MAG: PadR family transcriptional regulator, partial [Propionibacteriales bacterium]|nr:PadR family transcriptional regulator [Propionibacteriales bacterium]